MGVLGVVDGGFEGSEAVLVRRGGRFRRGSCVEVPVVVGGVGELKIAVRSGGT